MRMSKRLWIVNFMRMHNLLFSTHMYGQVLFADLYLLKAVSFAKPIYQDLYPCTEGTLRNQQRL